MKKVLIVFGTRPEAIKMCPLIIELRRRPAFKTIVCVTGQHREMLDQVLNIFNIIPDYDLAIMKEHQTLSDITASVMQGIERVLSECDPDVVLVHGDTTTSFATSLACFYKKVPIAHVEAGLRTDNILSPWPEEFNRQAIDLVCSYYFAPTEQSKQNLLREGKPQNKIWVTGNTVIDALSSTVRPSFSHPELDWASNSRLILITCHRRENFGEPMRNIFSAIKKVLERSDNVKALYPIHKNPTVRNIARKVFGESAFSGSDNKLHIIEPLDPVSFHNFINASYLILTDSGGIQEEAPSLGKPVLVMRNNTERPEGIDAGTVKLIGTTEDSVYTGFKSLLDNHTLYNSMSRAINPYGDGFACKRISDILEFGHTDM